MIHHGQSHAWLDLRADDHADPLGELARLWDVAQERYVHFAKGMPTAERFSGYPTREGIDVGPYPTQFEARVEAALLLRQLEELPAELALHKIRDFAYQTVSAHGTGAFLKAGSFTDYLVRETSTTLTRDQLFSSSA